LNQPDFNLSHYPTLGITAFDKAESTILLGTKSSTVLEVTTGKKQSHTIVN
jgi:WD40 repeat protein